MIILWLNTLASVAATTVWILVARSWVQEGKPKMAFLYALAALGSMGMAAGFVIVMLDGDPARSAAIARQWAWVALGVPAFARLGELIHGEAIRHRVGLTLNRAEVRADVRDQRNARGE